MHGVVGIQEHGGGVEGHKRTEAGVGGEVRQHPCA